MAQAHWEKALQDLRAFDISVTLHGSRVYGLAHEGSDVDLLTSMPLKRLQLDVEEQVPPQFRVLEAPCVKTKPAPRLLLLHLQSGVEVDVVSRWSTDIFVRERDALTQLMLGYDARVLEFMKLASEWVRLNQDKNIWPHAYACRILAFHFLMTRVTGPLLPPLKDNGCYLEQDHPTYISLKKVVVVSGDELMQEWMRRLMSVDTKGLYASLRHPYEEGEGANTTKCIIFDPANNEPIFKVPQERMAVVAAAAKREFDRMQQQAADLAAAMAAQAAD
mmetsp:Transcript_40899/g.73918  ORF Transcript_40899/g.73918 Transcript_40899/m.73918 type:complete len:276 (-) Transcript_40899:47-874(-)